MGHLDGVGKIRLVTFDLYETLVGSNPAAWKRWVDAAAQEGVNIEEQDAHNASRYIDDFFTAENARLPLRDRSQEELEAFRFEMTRTYFRKLNVEHTEDLVRAVRQRVLASTQSSPNQWLVFDDVSRTLSKLEAAGVMRAVISNADADVTALCMAQGFAQHMDLIVTSAIVGWEKPDPRTFQAALDPLGVKPEEAIHVGDQPLSDVVGARAIGMGAALIDRHDRHQDDEHDAIRVTSLDQLADLVIAHNQRVLAS